MKKKCKVVMLPTNEKAIRKGQIGFVKENTWIGTCSNVELDNVAVNRGDVVPQHLYILSDEKIKVGDWYLVELFDINGVSTGLHVEQCKSITDDLWVNFNSVTTTRHINNCRKIIATTDKSLSVLLEPHIDEYGDMRYNKFQGLPEPSPEFVEVFIREYNKGNVIEEVMVEYETRLEQVYSHSGNKIQEESEPYLKVDKNNYITITRVKDSWGREEIFELFNKFRKDFPLHRGIQIMDYELKNWIEQNL